MSSTLTPAQRGELDRIWEDARARTEERDRRRRQRPLVRLWDGDWVLRGRVQGEYEASFEWVLNDTGHGTIVLPDDHHLARWAAAFWDRTTRNIHVTVDHCGARWSGRLESITTQQDEQGLRTVTLNFLHDFEELKHVIVWANPFSPAAVQLPKIFILAGPARYTVKLALFLNLARLQGSWWAMPDDPLDFDSWTQGLRLSQWPIMVKPGSLLLDDSPWTIINSRFKTWTDMVQGVLADAQLMVECRRWLNGDPLPWPGARPRNGQLIVDVVDKSGWFEQTAVGGTIVGGLARTVLQLTDDLIDETRSALIGAVESPEYTVSGFLGTAPKNPWVIYRTDAANGANTVETTSFTWQPATVTQIVGGGHSMPGVNEGISASIQLMGSLLSAFLTVPAMPSIPGAPSLPSYTPSFPDLGGPVDTLLKPIYEDTILAFMSYKSLPRSMSLGWSHYYEDFVTGADQAYTLSGILAMRAGLRASRERTSHSMTVGDGAPYLVGENGQGHFFLGDRIGAEIPGSGGRVVVDQVHNLSLSWDADTPHGWDITVGDARADMDPVTWLIDQVKHAAGAIHELGVI